MADDGLTLEAWSMPHVGTLTKKFNFTKWAESYTINHRYSDLCDGVIVLADDMPTVWRDKLFKIDEANHANDAGSMVRVLRGATPVMHYIITRSEEQWSDESPRQKITLEGLEWILDRALVPHYDHPADPTVEPDWIYGADTLMANAFLEDSPQSKEVQHFFHTQTAGTFTITYSGQTTTALAFNASWFDVHQALEALSNIQDVVVTGDGTATAPWEIEFLDPSGNAALLTSTATGASITAVQEGGVLDPAGWTKSFHPQTGQEHGHYSTFEVSTDQNHTPGGTHSLKIVAGANTFATDYPGVQQIMNVTGGRTYRFDMWVYPTTSMDFRLIVRTMDETAIDGAIAEGTLTANTWNHLVIDPFVVPKHISQVIVRLGLLETGGGTFYVDDGTFAPGFPEATLGRIFDDVLTAAIALGSPLSWLSPTWTTTTDSAGDPWDQDLKWKVNHDQSFLQLFEYMKQWNYEWQIRWDNTALEFQWDMFNPTAGGQVRTGIAIVGKGGTTAAAPIVKRPPGSTYVRVEGELGRWGENASTTLDDVWGRLERAVNDRQGVDSAELDVFAARLVDREGTDTAGRSVSVADPTTLPWEHFVPGDTVMVNMAPKDTRKALRVVAIVASKTPDLAIPKYDVHFVSPVLSTDAAMAQGLRTLWRKFNAFRPDTPAAKLEPPPIVGGGGAPTVVVAASDSTTYSKGRADFLCTGINDQLTIQAAITAANGTGYGGRVNLCEGSYYVEVPAAGGAAISLVDGTQLFGMLGFPGSLRGTVIYCTNTGSPSATGYVIQMDFETAVRDLMVDTTGPTGNVVAVRSSPSGSFITGCVILPSAAVGIAVRGAGLTVTDTHIISADTVAALVATENTSGSKTETVFANCRLEAGSIGIDLQTGSGTGSYARITNCHFDQVGGSSIALEGIYCVVTDNNIQDSFGHGIHLSNASDSVISDNVISNPGTDADNTYDGILVASTSNRNSIQGNRVTAPAAGNRPRYGVNISAGTNNVSNANVGGPSANFGTGVFNDTGTGTQGTNFTV